MLVSALAALVGCWTALVRLCGQCAVQSSIVSAERLGVEITVDAGRPKAGVWRSL